MHVRERDILELWEAGRSLSATDRALSLLEHIHPQQTHAELARLPIGRRDSLLLDARVDFFGDILLAVAECPACGETVELTVPAAQLERSAESDVANAITVDGHDVRYRLPASDDLTAIQHCASVDEARSLLLRRCIESATRGGEAVDVDVLPVGVTDAVAELVAASDPYIETLLDLSCPCCGAQWACELDIGGYFWSELRAAALCLLDDVHILARAYGWSEGDVLSLSPARRQWYVERVV